MKTLENKRERIISQIRTSSPFDKQETERILAKFFSKVPSIVNPLVKEYQLDKKKVLEIGSSYGQTLCYWGPGSCGVEVGLNYKQFMDALDIRTYKCNVEEGFLNIHESFDAIVTNNIFEHLVAPHLYLARLHKLLQEDGLLVIGHPIVPNRFVRWAWLALGYRGWLAGEHINFFTPETSRLTIEFAGFRVVQQFCPRLHTSIGTVDRLILPFTVQCLSICKKIKDFKYNDNRYIEYEPSWALPGLDHFHKDRVG